jgi:hypothetical protein
MRAHPPAEGGTVGEKCPVLLPKCRFPRYIYGSFTCSKAMTWDRRLYFPSEGRRAEDFFALKIQRLQPGANPRTWVPKASMLPLDHRSRYSGHLILPKNVHIEHECSYRNGLNGYGVHIQNTRFVCSVHSSKSVLDFSLLW